MSFIAKHITDDGERLIYLARLHWIYLVEGMAWFALFTAIGIGAEWAASTYASADLNAPQIIFGYEFGSPLHTFKWLMIAAGFFLFMAHYSNKLSTEIGLTNRRIIFKKGLLSCEVEEIDLVEIRAEKIHHGILGGLLGYGRMEIDSRFVGDIFLPAIPKPYKFLQIMHKTRGQLGPATSAI